MADVQARKAVCAPGQQHMFPLGDGRGGLLTRRRWKGSSPQPQHVQHIGEERCTRTGVFWAVVCMYLGRPSKVVWWGHETHVTLQCGT